jgi:hypothetical protein
MIRFIYIGSNYDREKEIILEHIFQITRQLLSLPDKIEIEFKQLKHNVYGETLLDRRFKNRIRLHENLDKKESVVPFVHELLHLNQIHLGRLVGRRNGCFVFDKRIYHVSKNPTMEEWKNMPWEIDVANKEKKLLESVLGKI